MNTRALNNRTCFKHLPRLLLTFALVACATASIEVEAASAGRMPDAAANQARLAAGPASPDALGCAYTLITAGTAIFPDTRTDWQQTLALPQFNPSLGTAVFRISQEALTNVARHASATHVLVTLLATPQQLSLEIRDNGRGITEPELANSKSLGLLGMRERALMLGGNVHISGTPGQGTTVTVQIPLGPSVAP